MKWLRTFVLCTAIAILMNGCNPPSRSKSDQAVLDSLRVAGSDMSKIHPIDFYLYHPEESGAVQICFHLQEEGFQVILSEGALGEEWLCKASISFVPSIEKLSEYTNIFNQLISQFGGEYDGWETIVIP